MSPSRQRMWQIANPEKHAAQRAVARAIQQGDLVRPPTCSKCATANPHAHHEDYAKPLEVVWLCEACHRQRHIELRRPELPARRAERRAVRAAEAASRAAERAAQRRTLDQIEAVAARTSAHARERVRSDEELLNALRALANASGRLSARAYRAAYYGSLGTDDPLPCPSTFAGARFASWNEALLLAGLRPGKGRGAYARRSDDDLVGCVCTAVKEAGHLLSVAEYERLRAERPDLGLASRSLIARRIGGWAHVLRLAAESGAVHGRDEAELFPERAAA